MSSTSNTEQSTVIPEAFPSGITVGLVTRNDKVFVSATIVADGVVTSVALRAEHARFVASQLVTCSDALDAERNPSPANRPDAPYKVDYTTAEGRRGGDWLVVGPAAHFATKDKNLAYQWAAAINAAWELGRNSKGQI